MQVYKRKQTKHGNIVQMLLRAGIVLLLAFICFLSLRATWGIYQKFAEASQEQDLAQQQLQNLQQQEQSINAGVKTLGSSEGLEAEVRERYGVAKPGEGEIQIVTNQPIAPTTTPMHENIFQQVWHLFSVW